MKQIFICAVLLLWFIPVYADLHLTVNGQPIDSINLDLDESCLIEVVSDESRGYTALLLEQVVDFGNLSLLEIKPAAGSTASVFSSIYYGGYDLTSSGSGVVPGVHFVFLFVADNSGATDVVLKDDSPGNSIIDTIQITMSPPVSIGSGFTYQGRLTDAQGHPADGPFDLQFQLYRSLNAHIPIGTVTKDELVVYDGYFTTHLDFGIEVFNGDARWLEIGVRPGALADPNTFITIPQRQPITPCPYALQTRGIFADADMNIGIGTTNPAAKLHLLQQEDADAIRVDNTAGDTNPFIIKHNGNVGIGTINPQAKLHVDGGLQIGSDLNSITINGLCLLSGEKPHGNFIYVSYPEGYSSTNSMVISVLVGSKSTGYHPSTASGSVYYRCGDGIRIYLSDIGFDPIVSYRVLLMKIN